MEYFKKVGFIFNVYYKFSYDFNVVYDFVELNKGIFVFVEKLIYVEKYNNICCIFIDELDVFWDVGFIVKKNIKISLAVEKFINYFFSKYGSSRII